MAKVEKRNLGIVLVDIAQVFDLVSHEHISWVLRDRGVDEHIVELIKGNMEGAVTKFRMKRGATGCMKFWQE